VPVSYRIFGDHRLVASRGWGVVTPEDFLQHSKALRADPQHDQSFSQAFELTEVTQALVSPSDALALAAHHAFSPDAFRAFIVSSDLVFGLVRVVGLRAHLPEDRIVVVRSIDEAAAFLRHPGLPELLEQSRVHPHWTNQARPAPGPTSVGNSPG
jgi:hypothetical protein